MPLEESVSGPLSPDDKVEMASRNARAIAHNLAKVATRVLPNAKRQPPQLQTSLDQLNIPDDCSSHPGPWRTNGYSSALPAPSLP